MEPEAHPFEEDGRAGNMWGGEVINKNTISQYPKCDLVQWPIQPQQSTAHNKAMKKRAEEIHCWT